MARYLSPGDTVTVMGVAYRIRHELGIGGQCIAYLAENPTAEKVCLKVLTRSAPEQAQAQYTIGLRLNAVSQRDGWQSAREHVIAPHAIDTKQDVMLVERYANGNTLAHHLKPGRRIVYDVARTIFKAVGVGLLLLEYAGVAHRDVKPENIVLGRTPAHAALTDLGLAGSLLRRPPFLGWTSGYSAPEQFTHAPASMAGDVYSLGCTMYHTLTGAPPFPTTPAETFHGFSWTRTHEDALHTAEVPPAIINLIGSMLEHEPNDRPGVREVVKTLS
ncbi:MAG: protein kinase [Planctomycetota bacterium]|nr:protein kinase [Planctomycetota bacterium]